MTITTPGGSVLIAIVALALTACAGSPIQPASAELGEARAALESARASNADELAPELYQSARDKVSSAEREMRDGDEAEAMWLAEEATLDARLAGLKAEEARTRRLIDEIEDEVGQGGLNP